MVLSEADKLKINSSSLDEKRELSFSTLKNLSIILNKITKEQEDTNDKKRQLNR
jgi:hypothetical protein